MNNTIMNINLPFRKEFYNNSDIFFTNKIKIIYNNLSSKIKDDFDNFTENLMYDNIINYNELIKAIEAFELYDTTLHYCFSNEWNDFIDIIYKYNKRDYDYCIII